VWISKKVVARVLVAVVGAESGSMFVMMPSAEMVIVGRWMI
jgi:hypothetical protein